mgnify:CR=1 FL=1
MIADVSCDISRSILSSLASWDGRVFMLLAAMASGAAVLLYLLDRPTRRVLAQAQQPAVDDLTDVPEGLARPQNV